MTLFSSMPVKVTRAKHDDRPRRRIPTGAPRLVESSADRADRAAQEAWAALIDAVRRSASARLALLEGRSAADRVPCPWARITRCEIACRCQGAGTVTVGFLRKHYERLALEISLITAPPARGGAA